MVDYSNFDNIGDTTEDEDVIKPQVTILERPTSVTFGGGKIVISENNEESNTLDINKYNEIYQTKEITYKNTKEPYDTKEITYKNTKEPYDNKIITYKTIQKKKKYTMNGGIELNAKPMEYFWSQTAEDINLYILLDDKISIKKLSVDIDNAGKTIRISCDTSIIFEKDFFHFVSLRLENQPNITSGPSCRIQVDFEDQACEWEVVKVNNELLTELSSVLKTKDQSSDATRDIPKNTNMEAKSITDILLETISKKDFTKDQYYIESETDEFVLKKLTNVSILEVNCKKSAIPGSVLPEDNPILFNLAKEGRYTFQSNFGRPVSSTNSGGTVFYWPKIFSS